MKRSESDIELPLTAEGAADFLASKWVEGIGPTFARRLVEQYGTDAIRVLADEPEKIEDVKGLGASIIEKARDSLSSIKWDVKLLAFLYTCGLSDTYIERIFNKYRGHTAEVVTDNPYSMVEDVWQLGFYTADKIGRRLGIAKDDPQRLQAALVSAVKQSSEAGHLFITPDEAAARAADISGSDPARAAEELRPTIDSGRLVESRGGVYLPVFYAAEKEGAAKIAELCAVALRPVEDKDVPTLSHHGHTYTPLQKDAIRKALESPVMAITGGPGSGKTTVVRGIIEMLEKEGKKVVLAAPTGRAAKRLSTLTGSHASTIHSLLGYRQGEGYHQKHIDADVLIVDEGSMMEQVLFNHLLQALQPGTRVILVGDVDQLPAIGAGDVLRDMIASGKIPVARLNENFRQTAGSLIASGARAINSGEYPASDPESDFVIIPEPTVAKIHDRILALVSRELPLERGIAPKDILVVTPQQIGPLGARRLNADLQSTLNPEGPSLRRGDTIFRLGDPVMQTANSRERGVYNGETGIITEVDANRQTLEVAYSDGRKSEYARSELSELVLAYATTVHKLQGSEARYIIIPVTMAHKPMLYRNLLYTAVSRATHLCVLVGEEEALRYAIANAPATSRNSNFKHRLQGHSLFQEKEYSNR